MNQVLLLIVIALFVILLTAIEYIDILKNEIKKRDRVINNLREQLSHIKHTL